MSFAQGIAVQRQFMGKVSQVLEYATMTKKTEKEKDRKGQEKERSFSRADFFRDLKKIAKKRKRPSRSDSETR